jgi:UDP-3-O-[3-hydroxymyristoyl] N-acetylglucosamine deacetylase
MAAFSGLSIDNAKVEVDSYELPIMDGSAGPFVRMLKSAGVQSQSGPRHYFVIKSPIELSNDDKFVALYPADRFQITCTIEYEHPLIQIQTHEAVITEGYFENAIANARTFGFLHEVEYMKRYGLAQGGSLENAIVIDQSKVINQEGLRYEDEFVRHKLLDCIGDLSLLGLPVLGHLVAKRSGHSFNHAFLQKFFSSKDAWQTQAFESQEACIHAA